MTCFWGPDDPATDPILTTSQMSGFRVAGQISGFRVPAKYRDFGSPPNLGISGRRQISGFWVVGQISGFWTKYRGFGPARILLFLTLQTASSRAAAEHGQNRVCVTAP